MSDFHFLRPWFLLALPLAGLLVYWVRQSLAQSQAWQKVIAPELLKHLSESSSGISKQGALMPAAVLAWCIACIATAGPSWQKVEQDISQQESALIIVLDLSLSMYAEDESPSRLIRARRKISDILDLRKEGLTALIAYSGDAHVVVPLTEDGHTIKHLLPALEPNMMPKFGSNLSAALRLAQEQLDIVELQHAQVVILTDEVGSKDRREALKAIKRPDQLHIITFGEESGAPIPIPQQGFLKDNAGTTVLAKLPYKAMQQWASKHNIHIQKNRLDNRDIQFIANLHGSSNDSEDKRATFWLDNGYYLVWLLLPFALLAFRRGVFI